MRSTRTYKPKLVTTPVFAWNYQADARVRINQGGTSSGKTYAILQVLMVMLMEKKRIATVVGQDIPNLKKGALRDFEDRILPECKWFADNIRSHNKTDRQFILTNGSIIEFSSFSDAQDAKNGKRDILFVNEANGISYAIYQQLAMRTNEVIFIDYNPTTSFWVHEHLLGQSNTVTFYSNFTHNPFADANIVDHVRGYKATDPESWQVYGLGKTGNVRGLVFRNVNWCDKFPENARKQAYGLDFGFTNDPTALVRIGELHGEIYAEELIYKLGMTNQDIAYEMDRIGCRKDLTIWADSAEPKSIAEVKAHGWRVKPATKGRDSVNHGIALMKQYPWNITAESTNWKKEQQNYKWQEKDGIPDNRPVDAWNHLWDAARYAIGMQFGNVREKLPEMI